MIGTKELIIQEPIMLIIRLILIKMWLRSIKAPWLMIRKLA